MQQLPTNIPTGLHELVALHATTDRNTPTARMMLSSRARSGTARAAIATLASNIVKLNGNRKVASAEYHRALEAMVAELLRAAAYDPVRACYRPLASGSFTNLTVGYQPFVCALADMERHGFVSVTKGKPAYHDREGTVTRINITPKLTDFLAGVGVSVANRWSHFVYQRAAADTPPIQLRAASTRKGRWVKQGKRLKVDHKDPQVQTYAAQIRKLNAFYEGHVIVGPDGDELEIALYRGFNLGNEEGHGYRKGGRAYAAYQSIERYKRPLITINGAVTDEVDISACFLTLAHHLLRKPFDNSIDPYYGPNLPREIIKAWVNLTIGNSGFHKRWPNETLEKLKEKGLNNVPSRYPINSIKSLALPHFKILDDWIASDYTWADLFYLESQIMLGAVECLAFDHGVVALPLHDGMRVPIFDSARAKAALSDSFFKETGLRPIIK